MNQGKIGAFIAMLRKEKAIRRRKWQTGWI